MLEKPGVRHRPTVNKAPRGAPHIPHLQNLNEDAKREYLDMETDDALTIAEQTESLLV